MGLAAPHMEKTDTLVVTQDANFSTLIRIAEGMSYNHETYYVSARGKNVQRGFEIVFILRNRGRAPEIAHRYEHVEYEGKMIMQFVWVITAPKEE
jgi:hypothetical protein